MMALSDREMQRKERGELEVGVSSHDLYKDTETGRELQNMRERE